MKNRLAGVLFGIVLILLGILFYTRDMLDIRMSTFIFLLLGIVFVILYISQNRKLSLVLGVYCIYFGISSFLRSAFMETLLPFDYSSRNFLLGGFFCCPGIILDILYLRERKPDQLAVGALFTLWGIALMLGASFFDACLTGVGACLIADSFRNGKKDFLQTGIGVFILIFGLRNVFGFIGLGDAIISVVLICCGGALIVKSILKERD